MDDLDELLRAISHQERRRLLKRCWSAPTTAGELASSSKLAIASVSEHLKVLRKTGLVAVEKQGRVWLYRTDRTAVKLLLRRLSSTFELD
ncbi:MAG: metalloregulator ArsR/SmtB family transcription factor [Cyanobacteria bacterium P01_F01_bin.153]